MPRPPSSSPPAEKVLAWVYLLPSLAVFALFLGYPLYRTFYLSAHGNDLFGAPTRFVGLDHYTALFGSAEFYRTLLTTALFVLLTVVPGVLGALVLVLLLEGRLRGVRVLRSAFALPFAFSVASAAVVFGVFYNPATGVLNGLLSHLRLGPAAWLTDPHHALVSVALATVWLNLGYNVLVLSAGVGSIGSEITEAARLDGAGGWRLARSITVPLLGPHLFFLVVVSTINALQSFGQINILTRGGPDHATSTLVYDVYDKAFANGSSDFGAASARAVVLLVVVLACTAVQFGVLERKVHYA
ncbi:glycerol-3-phosphate ABC transporter permease [Streptomyces tateyamensis]|uniref:Glycerol-3-phosphate ABC transporter permease n=1 Tax=Streptomyces tateyamensis TaxID=565073 RepID=A0A2V4NVH6_9ACTN|nr:sugar ABC transporter permease [Streptomyces tateyamensis]PYC71016.1 glycerol-3-phosphate ABC transporter permease [Streptomyces tateyamensis]